MLARDTTKATWLSSLSTPVLIMHTRLPQRRERITIYIISSHFISLNPLPLRGYRSCQQARPLVGYFALYMAIGLSSWQYNVHNFVLYGHVAITTEAPGRGGGKEAQVQAAGRPGPRGRPQSAVERAMTRPRQAPRRGQRHGDRDSN